MGARLVGKAYAFAANNPLKPNEFRLLAWMALTAKDTDQPPRYFASREESALGLGIFVSDAEPGKRDSAFELVRKAIAGLVDAEAIERVKRGRVGQRAEFTILTKFNVTSLRSPNDSLGLRSPPSFVDSPNDSWGHEPNDSLGHEAQQFVGTRPKDSLGPRIYEEPPQELLRGNSSPTGASHLQPVDKSPELGEGRIAS